MLRDGSKEMHREMRYDLVPTGGRRDPNGHTFIDPKMDLSPRYS